MVNIPYDGLTDLYAIGPSSPVYDEPGSELEVMIDPGHVFTPAPDEGESGEDLEEIDPPAPTPVPPAAGAVVSLNCKQVQPPPLPPFRPLDRLSLTDDRLDGIAFLPTGSSPATGRQSDRQRPAPASAPLMDAPAGQPLTYGPYTLHPQPRGRGWYSRVYSVHHRNQSDPVATLSTHPYEGRRTKCAFHVENHRHYTGDGVQLLVGLLDAIGATGETLTHWEIQTTHPRLLEVPRYIHTNQLKRMGGRTWGVEVGDGGAVKGMRVGRQASPRSFNIYRNGKDLDRRNRQYITARTVADGVATPGQEKDLTRLELHVKGREFKGLTYTDASGTEQPVTVRSLLNPSVRLAVFRRQIETAFVFRKRTGKDRYAAARFFDWESIEAHYYRSSGITGANDPAKRTKARRRSIYARRAVSTFGAKQTVKQLTRDGRGGDYLPQALRPELEQTARRTLLSPDRLKALTDTLAAIGCGVDEELVQAVITAHLTDAAAELADQLSRTVPEATARAVAKEHHVTDYYRKQIDPARALPAVQRPPTSVKHLKWVDHGV